jgi:F-type H+-transporting ATPase subunit gamma
VSQLIQIRQRIKAIETIQKVTHAMRLIAMSNHNHLRARQPILVSYQKHLAQLFFRVQKIVPEGYKFFSSEQEYSQDRTLLIMVGSQKGLCGTFNNFLFRYFQSFCEKNPDSYDFIMIGKRAVDYANKKQIETIATFSTLSNTTIDTLAKDLTNYIINNAHKYKKIVALRNVSHGFFSQVPTSLQLFPFEELEQPAQDLDCYEWEQSIEQIAKTLSHQALYASVQLILFQSLFSEQAARFQSMDSATRNAQELLDTTQRNYNKLRQAKITKELTELVASFGK